MSEEDVRNDPAKEKLADKAFNDFVNSDVIQELAYEYQYRYDELAGMKGSKEYPKAYAKYIDDLSTEVSNLLDHPKDATKVFNAGDGNFIDKESAVITALHCANENARDERMSRFDNAKNNDRYDLYFLELVQNKKVLSDHNPEKLLKEYKLYLENPVKFKAERLPKLPEE